MKRDRNGPKNSRWKGGVCRKAGSYVRVLAKWHPRSVKYNYVYEHVLVAEKALGKFLPAGAVVHHVDECKSNNTPSNLVICQNNGYQMLLHARMRIQKAGGDPNTAKICSVCAQLKPRILFSRTSSAYDGLHAACKECDTVRRRVPDSPLRVALWEYVQSVVARSV